MSNLNRVELRARRSKPRSLFCPVSRITPSVLLYTGLHWQREKELQIDKALGSSSVDIEALRRHAVSMGGLIHADIRKKVWPKLVGVNMYSISPYEGDPLINHKDKAQVLLDVNRCSRRIPECKLVSQAVCIIHLYCYNRHTSQESKSTHCGT